MSTNNRFETISTETLATTTGGLTSASTSSDWALRHSLKGITSSLADLSTAQNSSASQNNNMMMMGMMAMMARR
ncbi:MAG TPA: ComC/BlpC family leader-containing pheromone/bacteriocin [Kofleriaceae bacterium]